MATLTAGLTTGLFGATQFAPSRNWHLGHTLGVEFCDCNCVHNAADSLVSHGGSERGREGEGEEEAEAAADGRMG